MEKKEIKELEREQEALQAFEKYKLEKKEFIEQDLNFSRKDILKYKLKYPFTKQILKLITLFQKEKIVYLNDNKIKIPKGRKAIYANTHRFKPDFEKITITTKRASFIVASDFKNSYKTINGWYFNTRPAIFVDPESEEDKNNTFFMICKYLDAGLDGMIFPEAVWNFSENRIVLDTFLGAVKAALEKNAVIVCNAIERYDKKYVINRKLFDPVPIVKKYTNKDFNDLDENDEDEKRIKKEILLEANNTMRFILAQLLMEIWNATEEREYIPYNHFKRMGHKLLKLYPKYKRKICNQVEKRKDIPDDYWENYINGLMEEWPGYKLEDNINQQYQNPEIKEQQEVEEDLQNILKNPNENNFFMGMSNERFQKYMEIKKDLKQIEENLLKMREQQEEILPIEERLILYKKRKLQDR